MSVISTLYLILHHLSSYYFLCTLFQGHTWITRKVSLHQGALPHHVCQPSMDNSAVCRIQHCGGEQQVLSAKHQSGPTGSFCGFWPRHTPRVSCCCVFICIEGKWFFEVNYMRLICIWTTFLKVFTTVVVMVPLFEINILSSNCL